MVNEAAFELVCQNMQETPTNCKRTFAMWKRHPEQMGSFTRALMDAWAKADGENQRRLAIAYPQIANCIIEYQTLPEKKAEKYITKLLGE